jgi:hypothetical protein
MTQLPCHHGGRPPSAPFSQHVRARLIACRLSCLTSCADVPAAGHRRPAHRGSHAGTFGPLTDGSSPFSRVHVHVASPWRAAAAVQDQGRCASRSKNVRRGGWPRLICGAGPNRPHPPRSKPKVKTSPDPTSPCFSMSEAYQAVGPIPLPDLIMRALPTVFRCNRRSEACLTAQATACACGKRSPF